MSAGAQPSGGPLPPGEPPSVGSSSPRASDLLRGLANSRQDGLISLGDMANAFGERAFGIMMIAFCLPNLVPVPGIGALFGLPLLLLALQMAVGRKRPWLPRALETRGVSRDSFVAMLDRVEPRLRRIENVLRPRWTFLFSAVMDRVIGVFAVLCAVSIIIPFPGTNFPPAVALILISLAVTEEDGLYLVLGAVIGLIGIAYTTILVGGLAYAALLAMMSGAGA